MRRARSGRSCRRASLPGRRRCSLRRPLSPSRHVGLDARRREQPDPRRLPLGRGATSPAFGGFDETAGPRSLPKRPGPPGLLAPRRNGRLPRRPACPCRRGRWSSWTSASRRGGGRAVRRRRATARLASGGKIPNTYSNAARTSVPPPAARSGRRSTSLGRLFMRASVLLVSISHLPP